MVVIVETGDARTLRRRDEALVDIIMDCPLGHPGPSGQFTDSVAFTHVQPWLLKPLLMAPFAERDLCQPSVYDK